MNDDDQTNRHVRLLRLLTDEARREPMPAVDWPAVERRVNERIAPLGARRRTWHAHAGAFEALRRVAGLAAAAAAVAWLVAANGPNETALGEATRVARAGTDAPAGAKSDPAAVSVGDVVETGGTPPGAAAAITVRGVGSWRLGAASRAVVRATAEPYLVALERGSLEAEIEPVAEERGMVESFVVEVGQTRVAVHGTAFSVRRLGDHVEVEVLRGTVAVGPAGHRGLTIGHLLVAPARAEFSLDGGRQARMLPLSKPGAAVASIGATSSEPPVPAALEPDEVAAAAPLAPGTGAPPTPGATLPAVPTAAAPGLEVGESATGSGPVPAEAAGAPPAATSAITAAEARALVTSCLAAFEDGAGGAGVRVTISTQVTLHRADSNRIGSVQFSPPLRPDLQERCARPLLGRPLVSNEPTVRFSVVVAPR